MAGKLYLVATPIGNLGDLSPRAVETLQAADIIAAEDTRNSIHLLTHFGITGARLTSYHKFNRIEKAEELIGQMLTGADVALITDAGMPAISDPGEDLVRMCYEAGIEVTVIPGPCAAVSALALSGLPTGRFVFEGFLPTEKKELKPVLESLKKETRTVILYEAPHRLAKTLALLEEALGSERKLSLVREITKVHEEVIPTNLGEAVERYSGENTARGEFVLVLAGRDPKELAEAQEAAWDKLSVREHVALYVSRGMDKKDAMKQVALERGMGKREVYKECLDAQCENT